MTWPFLRVWRIVLTAGSAACALAILGVMAYRERDLLFNYHWHLRWEFVAFGFFLFASGLLLAAGVWAGIMRTLGSKVAYEDHLRYYIISQLTKRLPGTIWYVASRGYLYRQHGESARLVTLASALELVISLVSGALVALALGGGVMVQLPAGRWSGLLLTLVVGALAMHPVTLRWLFQRLRVSNAVSIHYRALLTWLAVYMLIWLIGGLILLCIVRAMGVMTAGSATYMIGSWCLVGVLSVLVLFLPSNFGFTEVGLSFLLANVMPSSIAVIVAILMRIAMLIYELLMAGFCMVFLRMRRHPAVDGVVIAKRDHRSL
jgi:uncharacterized membrane protein YbhN (UPF0104 family)